MWHKRLLDIHFNKLIFLISNAVFWACGWGALAVGIWLYTQKNIYSNLAPTSYSAMSAAGLCTTVGAVVLIISFIGCIGNWINSKGPMISYFCFVLLLFLIQCMTGFMGAIYQETVRERAKLSLRHTINATYGDSPKAGVLWSTWQQMQNELKCCGADSYSDWFYYPGWKGKQFVPDSCCDQERFDMSQPNATLHCGKSVDNHELFYQQGCAQPFSDWLLQHLHVIGIVALLFGVVEIFVLATSLRLIVHLHRKEKRTLRCSKTKYKFCRNNHTNEESLVAVDEAEP